MDDRAGKVAIVTGGNARLGKSMATAMASRGAKVVVHFNSSSSEAEATVKQILHGGGEAVSIGADLSKFGNISKVLDRALDAYGGADILINNAALFEDGDIDGTTPESWDRQFALNLKAPFFLSKEFARRASRDSGHIVNIVGVRGLRLDKRRIAYSLTKAALAELTNLLAEVLGPSIRVNAIAPGAILAPRGADEKYLERVAEFTPLKKTGSAEDIVRALFFLLDSPFITGELITVDGGAHL